MTILRAMATAALLTSCSGSARTPSALPDTPAKADLPQADPTIAFTNFVAKPPRDSDAKHWLPGTSMRLFINADLQGRHLGDYPSIVLEASHPNITIENGEMILFAMAMGPGDFSWVLTAPADIKPDTVVEMTIRGFEHNSQFGLGGAPIGKATHTLKIGQALTGAPPPPTPQ